MSQSKNITVGELYEKLKNYPPEAEVTFGSSTYSKRPLIFYRFKRRGEELLQIELNEVGDGWEPTPEIDNRITVERILKELSAYKDSDEVIFGATIDAVPLDLRNVSSIVSFNLEQGEPPNWRYVKRDWED